jgi:hypothetical protein
VSEPDLLHVDGVRVGMGGAALLVMTAAGVAVGLSTSGFTVVLAVIAGACAATVGQPGALLLGVTGWALCTGFGVNELGELTFAQTDCLRLVAYVGWALLLGGDQSPAQ